MDATHGFVANLSDGTVAVEHKGDYTIIEGERKPWVRLCDHLLLHKLHITALRYNINGQTYHAPKLNDRFQHGGEQPDTYSLQYIMEREESEEGVKEFLAVDIGAQYGDLSINQVIEVGGQKTVWLQVRKGHVPMATASGKNI